MVLKKNKITSLCKKKNSYSSRSTEKSSLRAPNKSSPVLNKYNGHVLKYSVYSF